ncbi:S-layer homology domain-containing protein [Clostridium aminobutyricum]|uniref:S-layer homology domain-containing protein n=1 Tax=Clostridium aminobutyricum TaxID=33953 RepID=A0A939IGX2_CLOAM|nr:S-layer homology domain-containing protein [Clostridium aminobutyricum]MBN7774085.1 S-layer homology domain-containing protein [Clostridium aminobutyricum]
MRISGCNSLMRCLVFFLAFILAIPIISVPTAVHAASLSDIRDHWAEQYIKTAVSKGFVSGYPDATFRPDKDVSRAEFTSMINKALENTGTASISFTDVPSNEWYYKDIQKGMSASFVGGYDDNTFRPNSPVTRQEAAVMLSRIIPTYGNSANLQTYSDSTSVSDWATTAMSKVCSKGYMGAYKDGKLHPLDNLTRAQTAKILCDILNSETIASGTTTVRSTGTTLSNRIYTNDVVLHSDLGDGEATLSNCVVLGTLYVYGGGANTVTVKNSRIANAIVEKSSSSVRLLASGESVIANATTGKTAILETSSLTGGIYGTGYNLVNIKGSADTTLKGSFVRVNVIGTSANVELASGAITTLTVDSSGKNSDITIGSNARVTTANVNGAAAFHGSGTINTMNANTADITYETKPTSIKGSYNPGLGSGTLSNSSVSITPKNGATNVDVDEQIVLTFNAAITKYNGTALTSSNIDDVIKVRKKTSAGSEIDFSASINSAKKVITITPDDDLDEDTKYYVTIDKNALKIGSSANSAFSSYFTTGDGSGGSSTINGITISPKKGATNIDVDTKITLTFDSAVTKYNGSALSSSNIPDIVELHKKTESGTEIDCSASINSSKKTITLTPKDNLDEDTKYYVTIDKNTLKIDGTGNSAFSSYFTTDDESNSSVTYSPKNGATGVSSNINPTISFSKAVETYAGKTVANSYLDSDVIIFREGSSSGTKVPFDAIINSSKKTITIEPKSKLKEGQKYYLAIVSKQFRTQSGQTNIAASSVTWTTATNMDTSAIDTAITRANNAKSGVVVSNDGSEYFSTVYWVTQAQMNALNSAISTATSAKSTATTTAQVQNAVTALDTATAAFTSSKKPGIKAQVNTTILQSAISNAKNAKEGIEISADGFELAPDKKWVTQQIMNDLNNAISTAEAQIKTVDKATDVSAYTITLNTAVDTFKTKISYGNKANKASLQNAINEANQMLSTVDALADSAAQVPQGKKWVTQAEYNALGTAISSAEAVNNKKTATQAEVDTMTTTLKAATQSFPIKEGTAI